MNLDDARELADAVRRACPDQKITDETVERWPGILHGLTKAECLVAIGVLGAMQREVWAPDILRRVQMIRASRDQPEFRPGGDAHYADILRHNGTEYAGAGKPRVPVPVYVYEAALEWARRREGQP